MLIHRGFNYDVKYEKTAEKFFKKHEDVRKKYIKELNELFNGNNPERVNVKVLKGKKNEYYRMRIGEWRVIFSIVDGVVVVINTVLAGSRGDIYKKMDGLN